jgi:hypothetical protein
MIPSGWRLRRRCARALRGLCVPTPFDVREFCSALAARRGRPIHLLPLPGLTEVCGLWVATGQLDLIAYERNTTRPHQDHIVLHEIGHMLCDHCPTSLTPVEQARLLLPSLDPAMVSRVLGRTGYGSTEEREAEFLASLIRQYAENASVGGSVADRLRSGFGGRG